MTTRSREGDLAVMSGHAFLPVALDPAESLACLRSTLQRPAEAGSDFVADLAGLAEDLGHLPPARPAAAYLDYNVSCSAAVTGVCLRIAG